MRSWFFTNENQMSFLDPFCLSFVRHHERYDGKEKRSREGTLDLMVSDAEVFAVDARAGHVEKF